MRLTDFIDANVEPILAEWEVFARSIWPNSPGIQSSIRPLCGMMLKTFSAPRFRTCDPTKPSGSSPKNPKAKAMRG